MSLSYMIDIETSGVSPDRNAILQIAAVRFDLEARTLQSDVFNECLFIPPTRFWSESTRDWWAKKPRGIITNIIGRSRPWREVILEFVQWVNSDNRQPRDRYFWAHNSGFDSGFLASYFTDAEVSNPFNYGQVRDINTFLEGRAWPDRVPKVEVEKSDLAHNALVDCYLQIDKLFKTLDALEGRNDL